MSVLPEVVTLSRIQFGMTALYHFLFVPLTLGLSFLLAIMESVYVMTNRTIWRDMVKFWGTLFGINFAMGVATGITLEFQFGTNWAYYATYVGDIFGAPLAIEGIMAFFLEATFVGIFFFGWDRISKVSHLAVTWLLAFGTSLSALWILIANAWMQHPVGSHFNYETMRMEVSSFYDVLFNPVAQAKFVHTVSAGYVTGSIFVLAISSLYLLRGKHVEIAKRSITVAAAFGLAAALSVVVLGDESGYLANDGQHMKLAAMESLWTTQKAPAALTVFGIPNQEKRKTEYEIRIPWLLGLIATRSLDTPIEGINELEADAKLKIRRGQKAVAALQILELDPSDKVAQKQLATYQDNMGYGLLLKRYTDDVTRATPQQVDAAAGSLVPQVWPLFWGFRIMVACGLFFICLFTLAFYLSATSQLDKRWFQRLAVCSLPLPWISIELGWFIAEYGRQPWVIQGILPTFLGTSSLSPASLWTSLIGFILFYSLLAVVEIFLMVKYIRLGPNSMEGQMK